jgi:hypothetical protein
MLRTGTKMYKYTSAHGGETNKKRMKQVRHMRVFRISGEHDELALTWRQPTLSPQLPLRCCRSRFVRVGHLFATFQVDEHSEGPNRSFI